MTVHRLSVSVPVDLAADIREAAEAAGWSVSVWLVRAAEDRLELERQEHRQSRALDELLERVGPIPEEVRLEVDEFLERSGVLDPDYEVPRLEPERSGREGSGRSGREDRAA
jgi:hypothetical protein